MCASQSETRFNGYEVVDHAMDTLESVWQRVLSFGERGWRMFGMEAKLLAAKQYAMDHPILTLCGLLTMCMCSIPIICFMFFAMGTLFFTFLGFLFVEGFLLTFASVLLGGGLFVMGLLSVGASSILALLWCLVSASSGAVNRVAGRFKEREGGYIPSSWLGHQHTNGECVKDQGSEKEQ